MKTIKGKLRFLNLFHPILLDDVDIWGYFHEFFESINGRKSSMDYSMDDFSIKLDENSEYEMRYETTENDSPKIISLKKLDFGWSNLGSYIPDMFQRFNGRNITLTVTDEEIKISSDPDENVYGTYYTDGNSCSIPDDKVKELCRPGSEDCCIFLVASGNGFECVKFDSYMARQVLHRLSENTMNAKRIGDCVRKKRWSI